MDKLQPILKNHFWILLVPLFSMNLWGYFSANSQLRAATEARQKELDSVKSAIPAGKTDPNASYTEELKKTNDVLVTYVDKELLELWNRQKKRMVWPARVAADIPKVYKSDIKSTKTRLTYQTDFSLVRQQVFETVEPYVFDRKGITWTPKVDFPIEFINPYWAPGVLPIDSPTMWDNQEDLWLTQLILEAIREINKDADSESSAMIRKVINFRLLGGNGESSVMPSEAGSESNFGGDEDSVSQRRPVGPAAAIMTSVAFDPSEEFGTGGDPSMVGRDNAFAPMSEDEDVDVEAPTGPLRYVKEDEAAPFVQRGFYLSVIINQNKMVDFLVALANSEWPVQVTRFHFGKNPYGGPDPFTVRGVTNNMAAGRPGAFGDDDDDRFGRGRGGMSRPMNVPTRPVQGGDGGFGLGGGGGGFTRGRVGGGGFSGSAPAPGNTGYPPDALLQPDLVQLDLTGLITIYRQPKSEIPEEAGESSGDGAAPADASADATEGDVPTEQAAASMEGEGGTQPATADEKTEPEMENAAEAAAAEAEAVAADEFAGPEGSADKPAGDTPANEPAEEGDVPAGAASPTTPENPATEEAPATPTEGDADSTGESAADEFSSPGVPDKKPEKVPEKSPTP